MTIGLTTEQLTSIFIDSAVKRFNLLEGAIDASKVGESPALANLLSIVRGKYPSIDIEQASAVMGIVQGFFDAIVANNEALAKVIPHVET